MLTALALSAAAVAGVWVATGSPDEGGRAVAAPSPAEPSSGAAAPVTGADPAPAAGAPDEAAAEAPPAAASAPPAAADPESVGPPPTVDAADLGVVLTFSEWVDGASALEVGAYVPVVEGGGSCTLTLTSGGRTARVSGEAVPDVSTTSCGTLVAEDLEPGTWRGVVDYASATTSATPADFDVEVP